MVTNQLYFCILSILCIPDKMDKWPGMGNIYLLRGFLYCTIFPQTTNLALNITIKGNHGNFRFMDQAYAYTYFSHRSRNVLSGD